jgi:hypothetical protein
VFVGCRNASPVVDVANSPNPDSSQFSSDVALNNGKTSTTSVLPDNSASEVSPAAIDESDPRAVCQRFLESLQSGNRIAAENLLTRKALQVTGKAGLVLEPLSGPNSQFDVREPQYATIKNEVAYVDCEITDLDEKSDSTFTVSWIVKKQNDHWRIAGLLMALEEGTPNKMFSFENPNDVEEIKLRAADDLMHSSSIDSNRQAELKTTTSKESVK